MRKYYIKLKYDEHTDRTSLRFGYIKLTKKFLNWGNPKQMVKKSKCDVTDSKKEHAM